MYTPCHFLLFLVFIYGLRVCNKHLYIYIIEAYSGIVDRIIALIFETDTTNVIQTFPVYKIAVRIHRISLSVHNVEPL